MALSQKQIIIGVAILFCGIMTLRSCTRDEPVQVYTQSHTQQQVEIERQAAYAQQDPNVVIVQQPPQVVYQGDTGITAGHVAAGALGYMAGKSMSNNSYNNSRPVVNKNYYSKKVYVNKTPKKYTYKTYKRK